MKTRIRVKICGLTTPEAVAAAAEGGAAYVGFVFFPRSPRNIGIEQARELALEVRPGIAKVALTVDADDALIDSINSRVPLDMFQLHGHETPERVAEIRRLTGLPVMKVIGIADADDLAEIDRYSEVADQLLIETKPPKDASRPGGLGVPFDWRLIANRRWALPWMLAGGLTPENVGEAIALTGARQVDVSSGVESAPGIKDLAKIRAFLSSVN